LCVGVCKFEHVYMYVCVCVCVLTQGKHQ